MTLPIWVFWLLTIVGAIGSLSSIAGLIVTLYVLYREQIIQTEVEQLAQDETARYRKHKQ